MLHRWHKKIKAEGGTPPHGPPPTAPRKSGESEFWASVSPVWSRLKFFPRTDRETDGQIDRPKTICFRGHKKVFQRNNSERNLPYKFQIDRWRNEHSIASVLKFSKLVILILKMPKNNWNRNQIFELIQGIMVIRLPYKF